MLETPNYAIPYPEPEDPADAPDQLRQLALKIDAVMRTAVTPVGAITLWAAAAPPTNWLICNGSTVLAVDYPDLAAVLGSSGGDIALPDLRGRVPAGASTTRPLKSVGGVDSVTLAATQVPVRNHDHDLASVNAGGSNMPANGAAGSISGGNKSIVLGAGTTAGGGKVLGPPVSNGSFYYGLSVGNVGGNYTSGSVNSHENWPPYLALNFIIRAR